MRKNGRKIFIVIIVFLLSLEILLRISGWEPKFAADWVYRPVIGHSGPREELVSLDGVKNLYSDLGFRSNWLVTPKPETNIYSVVLLGDSITESSYMEREATYAGVLEKLLTKKRPRIHTLASADYGTLDETLALHLYKEKIQPNQIVLQFLGLNDFVNNTLAFAGANKSESDFSRPYVIPAAKFASISPAFRLGELPITYSSKIRSWLLEHSRTYLALYAYSISRVWNYAVVHGYPEPNCPVELQLFLKNPNEGWQQGIEATGKIFRQLKREAGEVPLLGVYFPSNIELDDRVWKGSIAPKLEECFPGAEYDRFMGEKRFLALAAKAGIRAISLRSALKAAAPTDQVNTLFVPGGHFSALGHQVAAREIAKYL